MHRRKPALSHSLPVVRFVVHAEDWRRRDKHRFCHRETEHRIRRRETGGHRFRLRFPRLVPASEGQRADLLPWPLCEEGTGKDRADSAATENVAAGDDRIRMPAGWHGRRESIHPIQTLPMPVKGDSFQSYHFEGQPRFRLRRFGSNASSGIQEKSQDPDATNIRQIASIAVVILHGEGLRRLAQEAMANHEASTAAKWRRKPSSPHAMDHGAASNMRRIRDRGV